MASKYDPLGSYLSSRNGDTWEARFEEVERVLGFALPPSARAHQAWWSNSKPYARVWLDAGWRAEGINLQDEVLRFRRVGAARPDGSKESAGPSVQGITDPQHDLVHPAPRTSPWLERFDWLLSELSAARPVFHSEADFQHALAWVLHEAGATQIRLERRFDSIGGYLDLLVRLEGKRVGIELKYWTRLLDLEVAGERFELKQQGANPLSRYDFLKDVSRLEALVGTGDADLGLAIVLTNDASYWRPGRGGNMDDQLRIHEGVQLRGQLAWAPETNPSTIQGREATFGLRGVYSAAWHGYSSFAGKAGEFRYLALEIKESGG